MSSFERIDGFQNGILATLGVLLAIFLIIAASSSVTRTLIQVEAIEQGHAEWILKEGNSVRSFSWIELPVTK